MTPVQSDEGVGPHRKTPELFSQDICLESIPDQAGGSLQLLFNAQIRPEERRKLAPAPQRKVGHDTEKAGVSQ